MAISSSASWTLQLHRRSYLGGATRLGRTRSRDVWVSLSFRMGRLTWEPNGIIGMNELISWWSMLHYDIGTLNGHLFFKFWVAEARNPPWVCLSSFQAPTLPFLLIVHLIRAIGRSAAAGAGAKTFALMMAIRLRISNIVPFIEQLAIWLKNQNDSIFSV